LLADKRFADFRELCWSGIVFGYFGGPPCGSWSRLLFRPGGPFPVRNRDRPFGLPGLEGKAKVRCDRGSELFLRHLDLMRGVLTQGGRALHEHPVDPGMKPYPSTFATRPYLDVVQEFGGVETIFDQCRYGQTVRKRSCLGGVLEDLESISLRCDHKGGHGAPVGRIKNSSGFHSAGTECYPSDMCEIIGKLFVEAFCNHGFRHSNSIILPPPYSGLAGLTPTGRSRTPSTANVHVWPVCEAGGLLPFVAQGCNDLSI
jgi:hypothetical protein